MRDDLAGLELEGAVDADVGRARQRGDLVMLIVGDHERGIAQEHHRVRGWHCGPAVGVEMVFDADERLVRARAFLRGGVDDPPDIRAAHRGDVGRHRGREAGAELGILHWRRRRRRLQCRRLRGDLRLVHGRRDSGDAEDGAFRVAVVGASRNVVSGGTGARCSL